MNIPEKRVQCQWCGKVRINGVWTRTAEVVADVIGFCKSCGEIRKAQAELRRRSLLRAGVARARRGYGPAKGNAFAGFREEDK